jgi:hypothetical protein
MLIGLKGYEDPEVKAVAFLRYLCADPIIKPDPFVEEEEDAETDDPIIVDEIQEIVINDDGTATFVVTTKDPEEV